MKKIILLSAFAALSLSLPGQTIVSVSGSSGFAADFTSLQEAIDSVPANSVIYVHAGTYGDVTFDKPLSIIGPGYFLAENPETQVNPGAAILQTLTVNAGAENSIITGLFFNAGIIVYTSNILISRNRVGGIQLLDPTIVDITIVQNYIFSNGINKNGDLGPSQIIVKNNYIASRIENMSGVVENNIIGGWWDNSRCFPSTGESSFPTNTLFKNNIFIHPPGPPNNYPPICQNTSLNNTYLNNLFVWTSLFSELNTTIGSGNVTNVPLDSLFISGGTFSTDAQWQLSPTSPAVGAGVGGVDCGMFGGATPYVLSGIPAGPHIYELNAEPVGASQGGLNVNLKVKISN